MLLKAAASTVTLGERYFSIVENIIRNKKQKKKKKKKKKKNILIGRQEEKYQ